MVRLYVKFDGKNGQEAEEYTLSLSDYKFDETIPADVFARPDAYGITYVESPISFENRTDIITSFAGKWS